MQRTVEVDVRAGKEIRVTRWPDRVVVEFVDEWVAPAWLRDGWVWKDGIGRWWWGSVRPESIKYGWSELGACLLPSLGDYPDRSVSESLREVRPAADRVQGEVRVPDWESEQYCRGWLVQVGNRGWEMRVPFPVTSEGVSDLFELVTSAERDQYLGVR